MDSLVNSLRQIIGVPDFYAAGYFDLQAFCEYFVAAILLCIVVSFVFKFILSFVQRF